jgi:MSHA biogenesis protein MshI
MFKLKSKLKEDLTAGISLTDHGIALAIVNHKSAKPILQYAQFHKCDPIERSEQLGQLVTQYDLNNIACNLVLCPADYQLLYVDTPDVPQQELSAALRWQIKDSIDFHIDDAVIEHIALSNQNTLMNESQLVVASRESLIKSYVHLLASVNCNLTSIDIAALATRNIISQTPLADLDTSIAVLNLWNETAKISVLLKNEVYLERASNLTLESVVDAIDDNSNSNARLSLDSLALELQRTFDYYESHSRQPSISHLCIMTNGANIFGLDELIQQRLGLDCLLINMTDVISANKETLASVTNNCIMAIGGALRTER